MPANGTAVGFFFSDTGFFLFFFTPSALLSRRYWGSGNAGGVGGAKSAPQFLGGVRTKHQTRLSRRQAGTTEKKKNKIK